MSEPRWTPAQRLADSQKQARQARRAQDAYRAAAARQLGISRTTLWRYLGKIEAGEPTDPT